MPAMRGFTLIELLVVISIIGVLTGIILVGLGGVRASARDTKRMGDLEQIRSGLEVYRADCRGYPASLSLGGTLTGDGSSTSCASNNVYISAIPDDPQAPGFTYSYTRTAPATFILCAYLEGRSGSVSGCGSCGTLNCNYQVINP